MEKNQPAVINRPVMIDPGVAQILKALNVTLPDNVKEIETETVFSDSAKQIVVPRTMNKLQASEELKKQYQNEEQVVDQHLELAGFNWRDGLVAIKRVSEEIFGWINGKPTWSGNPTEITVQVDIVNGKPISERAFVGKFVIGAWDNAACFVGADTGVAAITIQAKKKFADEIMQFFDAIRNRLTTASIYRGRNIVVTKDGKGRLEYEIIENKSNALIVLNDATRAVLNHLVYGSIDEPGKRVFLFTGNYGNGKTEEAMSVGRYAVETHGQSFFYIKDASLFEKMLAQAVKYQPCVIFMEDVDEITSGEERDSRMNSILNTLDGVQTKGLDLTVLFTTNHPDRINSALRRPGRIDLMVQFDNPNEKARMEIVRGYFKKLPGAEHLDYSALAGFIPDAQGAVIAEICKRAVKITERDGGEITVDIVLAAVESMRYQMDMMKGKSDTVDERELVFRLIHKFMAPEFTETLLPKVNNIHRNIVGS